ncbi:hypothetical protein FAM21823_02511 [Lentilactobacillus parabuchneri]|uniref:YutD family protein n=1 Tax=Lentilactobacillus parabuchneri TaxID=152331 RepID=UPI000A108DE9|nr:YutD family protein [Lentilactobacillus parabuchneri]ORM98230.1 hypothetical protein FAM21823_02511 [Lentilactobacillus parabuchneri]
MDRKQLDELVAAQNDARKPLARIQRVSETEFLINDHKYELDTNHTDGFDFDEFVRRYNPALSQYDYIVGDWGYGKLRLRGFFNDDRTETPGPFITALNDYILEDVNFGAAYFVVHNLEARPIIRKTNHRNHRNHAFEEKKVAATRPPIDKRQNMVVKTEKTSDKHHFIIRESKN